jgi:hypothetical protein
MVAHDQRNDQTTLAAAHDPAVVPTFGAFNLTQRRRKN